MFQVTYAQRDDVYKFIRKVFALPFLPAEHIEPSFRNLREKAGGEQVTALMRYVEDTWLSSTVWEIKSWCVFGQTIRTNNDCEGWHHRINRRAQKGNLQFHLLISLLYKAYYQHKSRWYRKENCVATRERTVELYKGNCFASGVIMKQGL